MTRLEEVNIKERRLQKLMEEKNLSAILLKKQNNFTWLSGGSYNMVWIAAELGMTSLLVTRTSRYLISNKIEAPRMKIEEGLEEIGFQLLEFEWEVDREAELVKKIAGDLSKVGSDVVFRNCLPIDEDIKKLRYSLTENEVKRYLFLGEKLSVAAEKVMLGVRPGDLECEIAGRVSVDLWKDRIDPTAFMVAADDRVYSYRHPIPTTRMVKKYLMLCVNARYKGLITTITRIVHIGKPDPKLLKQFTVNVEIECRMIEASRPGTPAVVPLQIGLEAYKEFGYEAEWKLHHQGGAMGYIARDTIVTDETKDVIEDDQAYCWNPSITGTKSEDGFIATRNGPLFITKPIVYPRITFEVKGMRFERPGLLILD